MDSGASISVLHYPTYDTNAKLLTIKQNITLNPSKTLTVANQTEVFVLHFVIVAVNTKIEDDSCQFTILFAVANIQYNIFGTPFFEEYIQNINVQYFTLEFEYQSKQHPKFAKFTSLVSKDYPYFSHIYRINCKTQTRLQPNSS